MSAPDDRELDRRVGKLPRSIDPPRDLFPDIERRITSPKAASWSLRGTRTAVIGAASVVALAAALGLVFVRRGHRPSWPWPSPAPSAVAVTSSPVSPPAAPVVDPLENVKERTAYRAAVSVLEASFAENRSYLSSDAAARVEQSLGILDHAIEATEQALARDPESVDLRSQLLDEYQQKIDALTVVVDLVTRTS
jgi:hypothetical protein